MMRLGRKTSELIHDMWQSLPVNKSYHLEKVWDPVTRLWHWLLAAGVITGWCIGEWRSFSTIEWHFYLGYTTGVLLLFRYIWGFVGPEPVRHSTLIGSVKDLPAYAARMFSRQPSGLAGHNPLGALSVIAMMLALTAQVVSGLFAEDDGLFSAGPLSSEVSSSTVRQLTDYHGIGAKVLLGLFVLHLGAIGFYLVWKKENLIKPMLTGWKLVRR